MVLCPDPRPLSLVPVQPFCLFRSLLPVVFVLFTVLSSTQSSFSRLDTNPSLVLSSRNTPNLQFLILRRLDGPEFLLQLDATPSSDTTTPKPILLSYSPPNERQFLHNSVFFSLHLHHATRNQLESDSLGTSW
ncbi:hypothetical protein T439DRAFT_237543 [Meredithblackwellia eburnea MCA 4105]